MPSSGTLIRLSEHEWEPSAKVPGNSDEAAKLRKQVSTLAEFGKGALHVDDIGALLQEATRLVSDAIDVDLVTRWRDHAGACRGQLGPWGCWARETPCQRGFRGRICLADL